MGEEKPDPLASLPDFAGKLVAFYVADPTQALAGGVLLEYPEFKVFGGRVFVVGRSPELAGTEWASQLPSGLAWDSVIQYIVFASREDYLERGKQAPEGLVHRLFHR